MTVGRIIGTGLDRALGIGFLADLPGGNAMAGAVQCLKDHVTWNDALAYCQWLSEQTGRSYRLPTEAQWEYACRAGTATAFHFGATVTTDQANYDGNHPYGNGGKGRYREQTVPVGSLPPNPWGLCEVHGNVWEWCQDWLGDYEVGPIADPGGPASGVGRALRGGSWIFEARYLRSAYRRCVDHGNRFLLAGFRLALGPELRRARLAG
ncbi:formylglycine-generating enzyme family protein [uncultured Thiodictyon sp.]|jgi:formylglycine-generating enzyme required for sulfatase activity|uniref:formylglycine-generating enzyme family protein n=1 Tax=uncultured Thiodictyon sp. TaxID=1846217 RepID=UPI0025EAC0AB|nr:formylglycine-generating enzyme family protein [uncultured Thiodictyon sp.]